MLMFGNKKKMASVIVGKMKESPDFVQKLGEPGYNPKEKSDDDSKEDSNPGLHAAADDLIRAVHAKDAKGVSRALSAHSDMYSVPNADQESAGDEANKQSIDD